MAGVLCHSEVLSAAPQRSLSGDRASLRTNRYVPAACAADGAANCDDAANGRVCAVPMRVRMRQGVLVVLW
jgi:hypothetical protein